MVSMIPFGGSATAFVSPSARIHRVVAKGEQYDKHGRSDETSCRMIDVLSFINGMDTAESWIFAMKINLNERSAAVDHSVVGDRHIQVK